MTYFTSTGQSPPILIARRGYAGETATGLGGLLDTVGSFVKDGVSAAVDVFKSSQQAAGQAAAYKDIASQAVAQKQAASSGMPGWVVPAGIGVAAIAVGAIVLSRRKKNPSRRRRR